MNKLKFRSIFVPDEGNIFVAADFSQAESWIVAYLSEDDRMKEALHAGRIHETTAAALYKKPIQEITKTERYCGKQCNHAFAYRMEAYRHMEVVNSYSTEPPFISITLPESERRHRIWHSLYFNVSQKWWPQIEHDLVTKRFLRTPYGRIRRFYGDLREGSARKKALKEATAFLPQSTIADHVFGARQDSQRAGGILEVYRTVVESGLGKIVNTSHDSVAIECLRQSGDDVVSALVQALKRPMVVKGEEFVIPVEVEMGENYGEMKKVQI